MKPKRPIVIFICLVFLLLAVGIQLISLQDLAKTYRAAGEIIPLWLTSSLFVIFLLVVFLEIQLFRMKKIAVYISGAVLIISGVIEIIKLLPLLINAFEFRKLIGFLLLTIPEIILGLLLFRPKIRSRIDQFAEYYKEKAKAKKAKDVSNQM